MIRSFFIACAAVGLFCGEAAATTVYPTTGAVTITGPEGARKARAATEVRVGESVMVEPTGGARVVYSDGCPINVRPHTVVTIAPQSPCTAYAQVPPPPDYTALGVVVGVGAIAGTIIYFATNNNNNDNPVVQSDKGGSP